MEYDDMMIYQTLRNKSDETPKAENKEQRKVKPKINNIQRYMIVNTINQV